MAESHGRLPSPMLAATDSLRSSAERVWACIESEVPRGTSATTVGESKASTKHSATHISGSSNLHALQPLLHPDDQDQDEHRDGVLGHGKERVPHT